MFTSASHQNQGMGAARPVSKAYSATICPRRRAAPIHEFAVPLRQGDVLQRFQRLPMA